MGCINEGMPLTEAAGDDADCIKYHTLMMYIQTDIWDMGVQVYGAVTMNNTMCLGLFLLVIYINGLPWDYSSEVLVTAGVHCPSLYSLAVCHDTLDTRN